jgi:uncharacterized protein DUF5670
MLLIAFVVLLVLWILGFTVMHVASFAIHLLLIAAVIALIAHFAWPHSTPTART